MMEIWFKAAVACFVIFLSLNMAVDVLNSSPLTIFPVCKFSYLAYIRDQHISVKSVTTNVRHQISFRSIRPSFSREIVVNTRKNHERIIGKIARITAKTLIFRILKVGYIEIELRTPDSSLIGIKS